MATDLRGSGEPFFPGGGDTTRLAGVDVPLDDMPSGQSTSARARWTLMAAGNRLNEMSLDSRYRMMMRADDLAEVQRGVFLHTCDTVLSLLDQLDSAGHLVKVN